VWWARLGDPAGTRPVLLLSRDEAYQVRTYVTVAPITTRRRRIPVEVALGVEHGMPRACVVNLDSMVTIARSRLERPLTRLDAGTMLAVERAVRFALDLAPDDEAVATP
jgi:mRNA interferase MazF